MIYKFIIGLDVFWNKLVDNFFFLENNGQDYLFLVMVNYVGQY